MIEREDKIFYTFRIETVTESASFYNLLVVTNTIGEIDNVKIFEYLPSDAWLENKSQPFSRHMKLNENDIFDINDLFSRGVRQCITGTRTRCKCSEDNNHCGPAPGRTCTSWTKTVTAIYGPCPPELNNGEPIDNNDDPSTGTGGGGGSGTGDGDPNNTDDCQPTIDNPCDDDETAVMPPKEPQEKTTHEKNCEELNKLTSPPGYNQPNPYLDDDNAFNSDGLNTTPRLAIVNADQSLDNPEETGFGLFNQSNFPAWGSYARYTGANNQTHHVEFIAYPTQYGSIHTHPFNTTNRKWIPMFSLDDIYSVLTFRNVYSSVEYLNDLNTNGDALFTSILIAKQGASNNTYAIKIEDITKFQKLKDIYDDQGDANDDGIDEYKVMNRELERLYEEDANDSAGTETQYQRVLLQFMADNDLGVSLYQMEQTNAGTPDVEENWKRLNLGLGDTVINSPCN